MTLGVRGSVILCARVRGNCILVNSRNIHHIWEWQLPTWALLAQAMPSASYQILSSGTWAPGVNSHEWVKENNPKGPKPAKRKNCRTHRIDSNSRRVLPRDQTRPSYPLLYDFQGKNDLTVLNGWRKIERKITQSRALQYVTHSSKSLHLSARLIFTTQGQRY